jgi:hypothetical protein
MYKFEKKSVPDNIEEKLAFVEALLKFGVALQKYEEALSMDPITM